MIFNQADKLSIFKTTKNGKLFLHISLPYQYKQLEKFTSEIYTTSKFIDNTICCENNNSSQYPIITIELLDTQYFIKVIYNFKDSRPFQTNLFHCTFYNNTKKQSISKYPPLPTSPIKIQPDLATINLFDDETVSLQDLNNQEKEKNEGDITEDYSMDFFDDSGAEEVETETEIDTEEDDIIKEENAPECIDSEEKEQLLPFNWNYDNNADKEYMLLENTLDDYMRDEFTF